MRFRVLAVMAASGCGSIGNNPDAAVVDIDAAIDASIDAPAGTVFAASCNAIHTTDLAKPSGTYTIDPDGPGGDAPISVTCDMQVDSGGWTIVYFPTGVNSNSLTLGYTAGTPRLMTDAGQVLIAFRSASKVAYTNYASFDLPADWRATTPFTYPSTDITTGVSINGAPLASNTVRYGTSNFSSLCTDPWITASAYGRLCIPNTVAPYFAGYSVASSDLCSNSSQAYSTTACTTDLRFSIAVR